MVAKLTYQETKLTSQGVHLSSYPLSARIICVQYVIARSDVQQSLSSKEKRPDAGTDSGTDTVTDARTDARMDARMDARAGGSTD